MSFGVWVRADYSAAADLFIGSNLDYLYSIACGKRIQEQGIKAWKIKRDFRAGVFENPPWPPFYKGGNNAFML